MKASFTTAELLIISGSSRNGLEEAIALGLIKPAGERSPGTGVDRGYKFGAVVALLALRRLREFGYPRAASTRLLSWLAASSPEVALVGYAILKADGEYIIANARALTKLLAQSQGTGRLILDIGAIHEHAVAGCTEIELRPLPRRGRKRDAGSKKSNSGARRRPAL